MKTCGVVVSLEIAGYSRVLTRCEPNDGDEVTVELSTPPSSLVEGSATNMASAYPDFAYTNFSLAVLIPSSLVEGSATNMDSAYPDFNNPQMTH